MALHPCFGRSDNERTMNDQYEWDEAKRSINYGKHRLDFADVRHFDWDNAVIEMSDRHGEARFVAYGYMGNRMYEDRMYVVVFTWREDTKRIISFRPASQKEVNEYG